ncbi:MAG: LysR family transcriptional regulator [Bacteroidia bacterium]|nr:LysR family transcriptional regulator [Bacteroidia bacterium]
MYKVKGNIWIENENGTFIGYGRAILLERVKEFGSISEAAKSMKMSYKHAWEKLDSMNRQSKRPLIETVAGGKGGGGTKLTEEGIAVLKKFWLLYNGFENFSKQATSSLDL